MAETEPTKLPEWASANPTDPISGQPAIAEPTSGKKASGHTRIERPPRQDHNWLFNLIWLWTKWFKQQVNAMWNNLDELFTKTGISNTMVTSNTVLKVVMDQLYKQDGGIDGLRQLQWDNANPSGPGVFIGHGRCYLQGIFANFDRTVDTKISLIDDGAGGTTIWPSLGLLKYVDSSGVYAQGNNKNGLANGVTLTDDTWYHIFLVYSDDDFKIDIGFDDDPDGSNLKAMFTPWNITHVRRISSAYWQSAVGKWIPMHQVGDYFTPYSYSFLTGTGVTLTPAAQVQTAPLSKIVPTGVDVLADFYIDVTWSSGIAEGKGLHVRPNWHGAYAALEILRKLSASGVSTKRTERVVELIRGDDNTMRFEYLGTMPGGESAQIGMYAVGYYDLRGRDWGQNYNPVLDRNAYISR